MVGVITVALLERKPTISSDLFSRYWRDVHGVMAARIPGFDSYVQHHVTPAPGAAWAFEGIAVVGFAGEEDRKGLATSAMTKHIHRDEQNVFRRALLYNLAEGAMQQLQSGTGRYGIFAVISEGTTATECVSLLSRTELVALRKFDLKSGDPGAWNNTNLEDAADGRRIHALLQAYWETELGRRKAAAVLERVGVSIYIVDAVYPMVLDGRATPVGLRGLDAVRTINEAGADNQLETVVEEALYGFGFNRPSHSDPATMLFTDQPDSNEA